MPSMFPKAEEMIGSCYGNSPSPPQRYSVLGSPIHVGPKVLTPVQPSPFVCVANGAESHAPDVLTIGTSPSLIVDE